jgi:hypothetical protein
MKVTINGVEQWVRGIYDGNFIVDIIVHPLQNERLYFAEEGGAESVYGEVLKAIAHQKGISVDGLTAQLEVNNNIIEIYLPEALRPGSKASPTIITPSDPVEVDLSKPIVYAARSEPYLGAGFTNGATVPEEAQVIMSDSRGRVAMFVVDGQLHIVSTWYDNVTMRSAGVESSVLFRALEILARMNGEFVDTQSAGNTLIDKVIKLGGKGYETGDTILEKSAFAKLNPESGYDFTVLKFK